MAKKANMKRRSGLLFIVILQMLAVLSVRAQNDSSPGETTGRWHIAVFLPLYLDSAFDAGGRYRFSDQFPKYLNPGLEFYEGLQLAMDSLVRAGLPIDISVYDSRSIRKPVSQVLADPSFDSVKLIFAMTDGGELRVLAHTAAERSIPLINVNYPNNGGVTNNPQLVILNSTLRSHFEALYKFIQRNWATSNIIYVRSRNSQDDRVKSEFSDIEKTVGSVPLKMKTVVLENGDDSTALLPYLDSTSKNVVLVGSLNPDFAKIACSRMASLAPAYKFKVIGMPTWDGVDFSGGDYHDLEIYYSTPFYAKPGDTLTTALQNYFQTRFYSHPSDMVFRGYEVTLRFGSLLAAHQGQLNGSVGEKRFTVFDDFDIQPVFLNRQNPTLDYLENKKLYFIKKVNGSIVAVY